MTLKGEKAEHRFLEPFLCPAMVRRGIIRMNFSRYLPGGWLWIGAVISSGFLNFCDDLLTDCFGYLGDYFFCLLVFFA